MRILLILLTLFTINSVAQQPDRFYATMNIVDANALKIDIPEEIDIISTQGNEAAVYMSTEAAHKLHDRILVHGPGYIFKASEAEAMKALVEKPTVRTRMPLTITEDATVAQVLEVINTQNIEDHILELEDYGTRFHTTATGTQAAEDLKTKWEAMAALYNRSDVSVRLFNHSSTNMPSVIMTIEGSELPDEYVIVGGHLDSTSSQGNNDAPGADDDASGIATITEATRALFEIGFVPKRTIEVMAYAAEEVGLVGSAEIADEYSDTNVNVVAVTQFDMTNFNGSANDIYFITDFTDSTLNSYLMDLLDHYNASGDHAITYSTSLCNYGCSDHASWTNEGFMASFPFEASFAQRNGNIHTPNDTYSVSGTADHATKFTKLCAEFLIETAKGETVLGITTIDEKSVFAVIDGNILRYDASAASVYYKSIQVYDVTGKKVAEHAINEKQGTIDVSRLSSGVYVANFVSNSGATAAMKLSKK
ncbi:MAG TPA: M20/M25/M40 family metallo-hydrolase [Flavobacteriaceae bacterium]|nr:M20/M25/M40 family metallo-hydrolase [Flavobacteriaceae bacterium]HIO00188.1 M20/M25/M40 family metallo-hydrolase [Flavobacteriaceae bacterium]